MSHSGSRTMGWLRDKDKLIPITNCFYYHQSIIRCKRVSLGLSIRLNLIPSINGPKYLWSKLSGTYKIKYTFEASWSYRLVIEIKLAYSSNTLKYEVDLAIVFFSFSLLQSDHIKHLPLYSKFHILWSCLLLSFS